MAAERTEFGVARTVCDCRACIANCAPGFPETVFVESGRGGRLVLLAIIHQFKLRRRNVADRFKQPTVVEPIDPFEGGVLDLVEITPGTTVVNDLGLEQSDDRLGEGVVVRVADAADRRLDAGLLQALSVTNREILAAPVAVMNHALGVGASPRAPARAHPGPGRCASSGRHASR